MLIGKNRFNSLDQKEVEIAWVSNASFFSFLLYAAYVFIFNERFSAVSIMLALLATYGAIAIYVVSSDAYIKSQHVNSKEWFLSELNIKLSRKGIDFFVNCTSVLCSIVFFGSLFCFMSSGLTKSFENGFSYQNFNFSIFYLTGLSLFIIAVVNCVTEYLDGKLISEKEILLIDEVVDFTKEEKQRFKNKLSEIIKENYKVTRLDLRLIFIEIYNENVENKKKEDGLSQYNKILSEKGE